jgi:hypothetical protein
MSEVRDSRMRLEEMTTYSKDLPYIFGFKQHSIDHWGTTVVSLSCLDI